MFSLYSPYSSFRTFFQLLWRAYCHFRPTKEERWRRSSSRLVSKMALIVLPSSVFSSSSSSSTGYVSRPSMGVKKRRNLRKSISTLFFVVLGDGPCSVLRSVFLFSLVLFLVQFCSRLILSRSLSFLFFVLFLVLFLVLSLVLFSFSFVFLDPSCSVSRSLPFLLAFGCIVSLSCPPGALCSFSLSFCALLFSCWRWFFSPLFPLRFLSFSFFLFYALRF